MANVTTDTAPYSFAGTNKIINAQQGWNNLLTRLYTYGASTIGGGRNTVMASFTSNLNQPFLRNVGLSAYSTLLGYNLGSSSRPTVGQLFPRGYPIKINT